MFSPWFQSSEWRFLKRSLRENHLFYFVKPPVTSQIKQALPGIKTASVYQNRSARISCCWRRSAVKIRETTAVQWEIRNICRLLPSLSVLDVRQEFIFISAQFSPDWSKDALWDVMFIFFRSSKERLGVHQCVWWNSGGRFSDSELQQWLKPSCSELQLV